MREIVVLLVGRVVGVIRADFEVVVKHCKNSFEVLI